MKNINTEKGSAEFIAILFMAVLIIGGLAFCFWFFPTYGVWQQNLSGKAQLAKASQQRQIQIEQAKAERESAELRAEAIKIIGEAAKNYPEYRTQEFIGAFAEALREGKMQQIIYVPTEANVPLLEAGKR